MRHFMVFNVFVRAYNVYLRGEDRLISREANATYASAIRALFCISIFRVGSLNVLATGLSNGVYL